MGFREKSGLKVWRWQNQRLSVAKKGAFSQKSQYLPLEVTTKCIYAVTRLCFGMKNDNIKEIMLSVYTL